MKSPLLTSVALLLTISSAFGSEPQGKDAEKLAGTWRVTAATERGQAVADNLLRSLRVKISGNSVSVGYSDFDIIGGTLTLDPAASPKTVDLASTAGQHEGKTLKGIYQLEEDALKLCFADPAEQRPKDFASTPANKAYLLVCERKKPATWLAAWIYDKGQRTSAANATVPDLKIFARTMSTPDDIETVCEYYQTVIDANRLVYFIGDKKNHLSVDMVGCGVMITGEGTGLRGMATQSFDLAKASFLAKTLNLNLKDLKVDPDLHLYTVALDNSQRAGGDEKRRPVMVRIVTQDLKDYTVTLVISRAKDEAETHIVATFVVR